VQNLLGGVREVPKTDGQPKGKAKGKATAPGQVKEAGERAIGKAKGKLKKPGDKSDQ
jgi:hypothetical protein